MVIGVLVVIAVVVVIGGEDVVVVTTAPGWHSMVMHRGLAQHQSS